MAMQPPTAAIGDAAGGYDAAVVRGRAVGGNSVAAVGDNTVAIGNNAAVWA